MSDPVARLNSALADRYNIDVQSRRPLPRGSAAQDSFNRASFTYTGDGTGDVRIHMAIDPPAVPHFGGAIDNLQLEN